MTFWLDLLAAVFLDIAGIVSLVRYIKLRKPGQLFISLCFLGASGIFYVLAFLNFAGAWE